MRAAYNIRRIMFSGLLVVILGASLSACGKRGEPLRPSGVEAKQSTTG